MLFTVNVGADTVPLNCVVLLDPNVIPWSTVRLPEAKLADPLIVLLPDMLRSALKRVSSHFTSFSELMIPDVPSEPACVILMFAGVA